MLFPDILGQIILYFKKLEARKKAQTLKYLQCKLDNMNLDPRLKIKLDTVTQAPVISTHCEETRGGGERRSGCSWVIYPSTQTQQ